MRNKCYLCLSWIGVAAAALLWTTGCGGDSQVGTAVERGAAPYEYITPDDPKPDRK